MENCHLSAKQINLIIILVLLVNPLVGMGIDLISPSLPAMSVSLQVADSVTKNAISLYMLGYAFGNFLSGILSDVYGRRKFVLFGLMLFVFTSLLPILMPHPGVLLLSRFLQGMGIGCYAVAARASLSDMLPPEKLIHIAPITATSWGLGPILGPMIGGYLQFYFDWQACFYFFAVSGFIAWLGFYWGGPETHFKRHALELKRIAHNFSEILSHKVFIGSVLLMGCAYSLLIVFNTLGPFLIQDSLHYSPVFFGRVALILGVVFLVATIVCRSLVKRYQANQIFNVVLPLALIIALLSMIVAYFFGMKIGVIVVSSVFIFCIPGLLYPVGMGTAMSLFRHLAGSSAAIMNLINATIVSLIAALMGLVNAQTLFPLALVNFILITAMLFCYRFLIRAKKDIMPQS